MYLAVCDDDSVQLQALMNLLQQWQSLRGTSLRCRTFHTAADLLNEAEKEPFTLYLLDVVMPHINGISAARSIRELDETADIVFLTSTTAFAYESYSVRAADYLLKPVCADKLFAILDRLYQQEQRPQEGLTLKCGATLIRVPFSRLAYVEVRGKHLYFNLTDGTVREITGTLTEWEPLLLAGPSFIRSHRSYIVNMLQIAELSPAGIRTFSGKNLPVSRLVYPQLQKEYLKLLFAEREGDLL